MPAHPATLPPGFRFHPTDEELIMHYLRKRAAAAPCPVPIIADVDIYKFDPWDLPAKSVFGDREWYFFSPRDRKYPNGVRPNRAAASGYWKATGTDKPIQATAASRTGSMIGVKKALVFYVGRPPKGTKTAWIMHEYRLPDVHLAGGASYRPIKSKGAASMRLDDWVLCRIFQKASEPSPSTDLPQDDPIPAPASDNTEFMYAPSFPTHEPREPSISDYLEGCPAVSEMFDSLPLEEERPGKAQAPFLAGGGDEASVLQQYMEMEEQDNTIAAAAAAAMLHQSKMLLNNASMPAINSFSGQLDGFGQSLLMNQAFFGGQ